ncbi:MAG: insulinase family protein [Clostridia bacterium]|nr:insulinase family protein [Clostridia bacterium]
MSLYEKIGDGVTFHYLQTSKFTTDYFSVHFVMPLAAETASGYCLLARLLKRGCREYPSQAALYSRLEELYDAAMGISSFRQGEKQVLSMGMDVLASRFIFDGSPVTDEALALLRAVLMDPYLENGVFSSAYVEREKESLKDDIRASINDKNSYALMRCRQLMCAGEPYAVNTSGTLESVDACTPESLYALYLRMLKEATVEIFYIGTDAYELARIRAEAFSRALGARTPKTADTVFCAPRPEVQRVTETVSAVQGKLAMGFRTGITEKTSVKEKVALSLFNMIYGLSPVSKLFMNVREKRSLCYYCASRNDNIKGTLFVYSGIENQNAAVAEEEILLQLDAIKKGEITEQEMLCAKEGFRDTTRSVADSPFTLEQWYLTRALYGDALTPEEMFAILNELTVEDVVAVASHITLDTVFFLEGSVGKGEADGESSCGIL